MSANKVPEKKVASPLMVILAFATVYVVWGSTYFFISKAIQSFPPFLLGALRFFIAAVILLGWSALRGEQIFKKTPIKHALVSGFLLLFIGNGAVIWVEQYLPSALVAILVSSSPLWFIVLDKPHWKENLHSKETILGLLIGFTGVIILFFPKIAELFSSSFNAIETGSMVLLLLAAMAWSGGSLYSKYFSKGTANITSGWQMMTASFSFLIASIITQEYKGFHWSAVSTEAWWSLAYLVLFGSILAFSAYVWLLEVRPATQVSTYAYVNPVVAVLLGVYLANEQILALQLIGLGIILFSVLLVNLARYRNLK